jgi:hypothetical protein
MWGKIQYLGMTVANQDHIQQKNEEQNKLMKSFLSFIFRMESRREDEKSMHNTYRRKSLDASKRY